MVIRFAPNKNNNQNVVEEPSGLTWPQTFLTTTNMSRYILSLWNFSSLHGSTVL